MDTSDIAPDSWREWRRLRALDLKQQGWRQRDLADALGVREETVSRWLARARGARPGAPLARRSPRPPPEAQTPGLREKQTGDRLSVMGGMTLAGKVYTLVRQEPLNGTHSVEFLTHLLRVAGKRLLVIWDGSPIHRRALVTEFVAGTRGR